MHLLAYTDLFRSLARRHKAIAATPANGRFMRIFISADPIQKQIDLSEWYNALRTKLQAPIGQAYFVLENYQVDYDDNGGDYFSRKVAGAFLVLRKVKTDDYDARDVAVDACERIAEQLLAAAVPLLREQQRVDISVGDAWAEHVGPLADGFVGVRLNLSWQEPATEELTYTPDAFTEID
jgi:hypothetical protein